jgi:membrane fusion protein, multidrug efflux system
VRIALDEQELATHPLQIGLSMQVEVDTHDRSGERLPQVARSVPVYATDVFGSFDSIADARVKTIIAANLGGANHFVQDHAPQDTAALSRLAGFTPTRDAVPARRPTL